MEIPVIRNVLEANEKLSARLRNISPGTAFLP